jgi:phospholipase C
VFADGKLNEQDEHPPADVQVGEAWTKSIYDALVAGPLWEKTALIFTYDEAGGFFDHVPPPEKSCVARPDNPKDTEFVELGVRVPLIAVSPWARRHYVSHVQHEHTSITRLIELVFGIPALTNRDANSDALLDMFDFDCKNDNPIPPAPAAGTGGCKPPGDAGATPAP